MDIGEIRVTTPEGKREIGYIRIAGCICENNHKITKISDLRIRFLYNENVSQALDILKRKNERRTKLKKPIWRWKVIYF